MTNKEFIEMVSRMRKAQQRFRRGDRSQGDIVTVRQLERTVDDVLDRISGPQQQGLFFDDSPRGRARNLSRIDAMIAAQREEEMRRVAQANKEDRP